MSKPAPSPKWIVVKSSTIQAVSYDASKKSMQVMFHGGDIYELFPVESVRHAAFMLAPSKGAFYAEHFKKNPLITAHKIGVGDHEPAPKRTVVSTPLYLALMKTKKMLDSNPLLANRLLYILWCACGKEATADLNETGKGIPGTRYQRCLSLIAEASGINQVGPEYLNTAIALASERKL